jgi:hypothetical protein
VRGRLTGAASGSRRLDLAVAVNGTIHAVTRTLQPDQRGVRFSAMVPEGAWRPGANEVEVLLVSGPPQRPVLQRIERDGP